MTTTELPVLPIPTGAVDVDDWQDGAWRIFWGPVEEVDMPARYVRGQLFTAHENAWVGTQGIEWEDGHAERQIWIAGLHQDCPLSIGDARRVLDVFRATVERAEAAERESLGS
jgi:hypothetical protein